jgi:hypothetical protein
MYSGLYRQVVFLYKWSVRQVWLYLRVLSPFALCVCINKTSLSGGALPAIGAEMTMKSLTGISLLWVSSSTSRRSNRGWLWISLTEILYFGSAPPTSLVYNYNTNACWKFVQLLQNSLWQNLPVIQTSLPSQFFIAHSTFTFHIPPQPPNHLLLWQKSVHKYIYFIRPMGALLGVLRMNGPHTTTSTDTGESLHGVNTYSTPVYT